MIKKSNLLTRTITGAILVAIVLTFFYLRTIDSRFFYMLVYFCSLVGTYEMLRGFGDRLTVTQRSIVAAFALVFVPIFVFVNMIGAGLVVFIAFTLCIFTLVFEFEKTSIEGVGQSLLALSYPTLAMYPLMLINNLSETQSLVALILVFVIAPFADTFAYFVGSIVKGRKLSEKISPKKTVSGAIGGIIGGGIGAIIIWVFFKGQIVETVAIEILVFLILGFFGAAIAEVGDLLEGAMKRKLNIKDMGKILPGHGGILDRIDGLIASSIFIYFVFMLLN